MAEEPKEKKNRPADETARFSSGGQASGKEKIYALPKIDFSTFVLSINSTALVQLGLLEDPASGQKTKNLPVAKQTIDMLSMLEEKTRGNLSYDENNILSNILYELRMLYVKEKQ